MGRASQAQQAAASQIDENIIINIQDQHMASQYELQLKATLDTSDVQQKLQQFRQS
jgi:hypothetical protein